MKKSISIAAISGFFLLLDVFLANTFLSSLCFIGDGAKLPDCMNTAYCPPPPSPTVFDKFFDGFRLYYCSFNWLFLLMLSFLLITAVITFGYKKMSSRTHKVKR